MNTEKVIPAFHLVKEYEQKLADFRAESVNALLDGTANSDEIMAKVRSLERHIAYLNQLAEAEKHFCN